MTVLAYLEKLSKPVIVVLGLVLIALIGFVDLITGSDIAFSVFYVLPISLVTWFVGRGPGLAISVVSAIVWLSADIATRMPGSHQLIPIWNSLIRLTFFIIITLLLSALKRALQRETALARIDHLTGAANPRYFYELAQHEIDRCQRYKRPFTLAYIDLDNFKTVNDKLGHLAGDEVLRSVASQLTSQLRKTDVVARMGGDEFSVLFPETDQDAARFALAKVQDRLSAEMQSRHWPVTFSIGVLTCNVAPESANELVKLADDLMYHAKRDGKNRVRYQHYTGADPQEQKAG